MAIILRNMPDNISPIEISMGWKSSPKFSTVQQRDWSDRTQIGLQRNNEAGLSVPYQRKRRDALTPFMMEEILHSEDLQSVLNIYNRTRRNSRSTAE